jgi:hypothetical protein
MAALLVKTINFGGIGAICYYDKGHLNKSGPAEGI